MKPETEEAAVALAELGGQQVKAEDFGPGQVHAFVVPPGAGTFKADGAGGAAKAGGTSPSAGGTSPSAGGRVASPCHAWGGTGDMKDRALARGYGRGRNEAGGGRRGIRKKEA